MKHFLTENFDICSKMTLDINILLVIFSKLDIFKYRVPRGFIECITLRYAVRFRNLQIRFGMGFELIINLDL